MRGIGLNRYPVQDPGPIAMILNSMLNNSPLFLFAMSALLGMFYGAVRLVRSVVKQGRHWRSNLH